MIHTPQQYREKFDLLISQADQLLGQEKPKKLKRDDQGVVIAYNLNRERMSISAALENSLEQELKFGQSMNFFELLENFDANNYSDKELISVFSSLKIQSQEVKKQFQIQARIAKEARSNSRNFFELDPSDPKKFLQKVNKILNPEEAQDYLLMVIYQTWADITNSPKIPLFDFYVDIFDKLGFLEANPLSANSYSKSLLNEKLIAEGSTPYRTNSLQQGAMKYNRMIGVTKGCCGRINPDGSVLVTEQDIYFKLKIPSLGRYLKGLGNEREYSLAEIAMKARMSKVVELAVERGFTHALTNHTSGFSNLLGYFRDLTGLPNPFAGKPNHR